MRGCRNAATVFFLSAFFLLCAKTPCFANPVLHRVHWTQTAFLLGIVFFLAFFLTVIVESIVVYLVVWPRWGVWWEVVGVVGLVELITFPPTQAAWWGLNLVLDFPLKGVAATYAIIGLEVLVAVSEFFLLRWLFGRLWRRGVLDKPVSNPRLIAASGLANAASFAVGFVVMVLGVTPW